MSLRADSVRDSVSGSLHVPCMCPACALHVPCMLAVLQAGTGCSAGRGWGHASLIQARGVKLAGVGTRLCLPHTHTITQLHGVQGMRGSTLVTSTCKPAPCANAACAPPCIPTPLTNAVVIPRTPSLLSCSTTNGSLHGRMTACCHSRNITLVHCLRGMLVCCRRQHAFSVLCCSRCEIIVIAWTDPSAWALLGHTCSDNCLHLVLYTGPTLVVCGSTAPILAWERWSRLESG